jgi:hypothetical protein
VGAIHQPIEVGPVNDDKFLFPKLKRLKSHLSLVVKAIAMPDLLDKNVITDGLKLHAIVTRSHAKFSRQITLKRLAAADLWPTLKPLKNTQHAPVHGRLQSTKPFLGSGREQHGHG